MVGTIIKSLLIRGAGFIQCIFFPLVFNTCNSDIPRAKDGIGIVSGTPLYNGILERDLYIYYFGYFCIFECLNHVYLY